MGDEYEFLVDSFTEDLLAGRFQPEQEWEHEFLDRPEVKPWHAAYWRAYTVLTAGRRSGWGPGPIPPSEVLAYLDRFHPELTEDEAMAWLQIIGRVDARQRELAREDA